MEVSQLKIYSLGVVAANKKLGSMTIEVTPLEDTPMANGEITDNAQSYSASAKETQGGMYAGEAIITASIEATWLPIGQSNRMTAPDVRRGETVVLYRFADVDKFYWTTLKNDMRLRKLETVIWAFSATRDESADCTHETAYFIEISTHTKQISITTCKADGEPFAYQIQLNTKEGHFVVMDDIGNSVLLDSPERRIKLTNADGSFLDIVKKEIFMSSSDLIDMKTKAVKITSTTYDQTATTNTIKAENQTITAKTQHNGNFGLAGDFAMSGANGGAGKATMVGKLTVTQDVVAAGVSLVNHPHPGDSGGQTDKPIATE